MSDSNSITTWIRQLKDGNIAATQPLWERYFSRMVKLAEQKLGSTPRRIGDEEDVALSAFHSFCQAVEKDRFPQLNNRQDLWQILVMHTARKVSAQRRHESRKKRGGAVVHENPEVAMEHVIGTEPDPQFAVAVADEFRFLLNLLEDEELRIIALRRLECYTSGEIAQELGYGESTIRRKTALIRKIWEESLPNPEKK